MHCKTKLSYFNNIGDKLGKLIGVQKTSLDKIAFIAENKRTF